MNLNKRYPFGVLNIVNKTLDVIERIHGGRVITLDRATGVTVVEA